LSHVKALEPDTTGPGEVTLPAANDHLTWTQAWADPTHDPQRAALAADPKEAWSVGLSAGDTDRLAFTTAPVVGGGKVFAMDALTVAYAYDLATGERLWRADLSPDSDTVGDGSFGGGLAFFDGKLYVTTGYGELLAVDAATGEPVWRRQLLAPARGAPVVQGDRLLVVTVDNETFALSIKDGRQLWRHVGTAENAALVGAPSVAAEGSTLIAPYTSGEIYALRVETGAVEWADELTTIKRTDQVADLTDIRGLPVIDKGKVFAVGNSDVFTAIDIRTGRRIWEREVGGVQTPWVAGDFVYLLTNTPDLACFEAETGKVRWVRPLPLWENEKAKEDRIVWTGPVLAGDSLYVVSSTGKLDRISPTTGEIVKEIELDEGVTIPPVVSGNTLLLTGMDGTIYAYR